MLVQNSSENFDCLESVYGFDRQNKVENVTNLNSNNNFDVSGRNKLGHENGYTINEKNKNVLCNGHSMVKETSSNANTEKLKNLIKTLRKFPNSVEFESKFHVTDLRKSFTLKSKLSTALENVSEESMHFSNLIDDINIQKNSNEFLKSKDSNKNFNEEAQIDGNILHHELVSSSSSFTNCNALKFWESALNLISHKSYKEYPNEGESIKKTNKLLESEDKSTSTDNEENVLNNENYLWVSIKKEVEDSLELEALRGFEGQEKCLYGSDPQNNQYESCEEPLDYSFKSLKYANNTQNVRKDDAVLDDEKKLSEFLKLLNSHAYKNITYSRDLWKLMKKDKVKKLLKNKTTFINYESILRKNNELVTANEKMNDALKKIIDSNNQFNKVINDIDNHIKDVLEDFNNDKTSHNQKNNEFLVNNNVNSNNDFLTNNNHHSNNNIEHQQIETNTIQHKPLLAISILEKQNLMKLQNGTHPCEPLIIEPIKKEMLDDVTDLIDQTTAKIGPPQIINHTENLMTAITCHSPEEIAAPCLPNKLIKIPIKKATNVDKSERMFVCQLCPKRFKRSDELSRHHRIHLGIKPYTCHYCHRAFTRSDHLITHMRTHTGEKPYSCELCLKSFTRSDEKKRHLRTHVKLLQKK